MSRNIEDQCIILRTRPLGEIHSSVWLLCRERGLVNAIAHGTRSARGSLRSSCQALNAGTVWLYHDPVRQSMKVKDLRITEDHGAIKADLAKYLHACVWLELFSRVVSDGPWEYELLSRALSVLSVSPPQNAWACSAQVLQRFLLQNGLAPDPGIDQHSGRSLGDEEHARLSALEGGFLAAEPGPDALSPGVRRYAAHTWRLGFEDACRIGLDEAQLARYVRSLLDVVEEQFQVSLSTRATLHLSSPA